MILSGLEMKSIILCRGREINEDSEDDIKLPAVWIPIPASLVTIARLTCVAYSNAVDALSLNHALSPSRA